MKSMSMCTCSALSVLLLIAGITNIALIGSANAGNEKVKSTADDDKRHPSLDQVMAVLRQQLDELKPRLAKAKDMEVSALEHSQVGIPIATGKPACLLVLDNLPKSVAVGPDIYVTTRDQAKEVMDLLREMSMKNYNRYVSTGGVVSSNELRNLKAYWAKDAPYAEASLGDGSTAMLYTSRTQHDEFRRPLTVGVRIDSKQN
jgi:hypothetical protein